MPTYHFIRSVPLLVSVEAESQHEAMKLSGERVDDFMTDAMEYVQRIGHDKDQSSYGLEYHGNVVYASAIPTSERGLFAQTGDE